MARDVREKKCGCIVFEVGPPVLCDVHQAKQIKREARQQRQEERGLRKLVADAAREHEAAIASATNDVRDYVSHIEGLTDKEKMGILSNLGWKFEPAVLLNRPRHD